MELRVTANLDEKFEAHSVEVVESAFFCVIVQE